jgi:hypothetical protein
VIRLFHVSDAGPLPVLRPRPSPAGTPYAGRPLVWAVDEEHLVNYLLPRDCPRVTWAAGDGGDPVLRSPAPRVVVVEHAWASRLLGAGLTVHRLDPAGFAVLDRGAGYWVSERDTAVLEVRHVSSRAASSSASSASATRSRGARPARDG